MSKTILFIGLMDAQVHHELPAYFLSENGFNVIYIGNRNELKIEKMMGKSLSLSIHNLHLTDSENKVLRLWKQTKAIFRLRKKADLLYLYSPHNLYSMFLGILFYNKPLIYHTQDFLDPRQFKMKTKIEKMIMKKTSVNFVNDVNRGMFLKTFYDLKQIPTVISTTLPKNFPFKNFSQQKREKWLNRSIVKTHYTEQTKLGLHIGPFSDKRCSRQLIESLRFLPKEYCLIFTGSPKTSTSFKEIERHSLENNVFDRIFIYDFLSDEDLMELTAQVDVGFLLYPANDIGNFYQSPGRLSEYVGSGIKVVASNFPSLELVLLKNGFGEVCDPYNAKKIAMAFKSVCSNESLERSHIKKKFKTNFSYEVFAEKILYEINLIFAGEPS